MKRIVRAGAVCAFAVFLLFFSMAYGKGEPKKEEWVIHIVGDIMLSRDVQGYLDENGYDYPYGEVAPLFLEDDLTIGNLECPITDKENAAHKAKRFLFRADFENADALYNAGFDCLSLANNHSTDYVSAGLSDTMDALQKAGIACVGAGQNGAEDTAAVIEADGLKIGILAFCALPTEGFFYDENAACISYVSTYNAEEIQENIASLSCDFKIVYFHWGTEYMPYPTKTQESFAHMAADAGADLVVGTHPHVLGENEIYHGVPIYYSLGNFVFDRQIQKGTDETVILKITLGREGITSIQEIPGKIEHAKVVLK